jgi:holo-ACP synthase/triphosphoribosyl-dephospho-CoA synthase
MRAFSLGLQDLYKEIDPQGILYQHIDKTSPTGPLAILAVDRDAYDLKDICTGIEEKTALGRLFDMDVLDENLNKIGRKSERCCLVCGASGRFCTAGRIHPIDEITAKMNRIMFDALIDQDASYIASIAVQSLIQEVKTTPKPGLVDMRNNGSHGDMTLDTFERSANALMDYFKECVIIGHLHASSVQSELFFSLKKAGIEAENRMYKATGGVNTHKGAIFSFGIICGAIGKLWSPENPVSDTDSLLNEAAKIAKFAIERDLVRADGSTAGERMYLESGATGIRGEAASGFASVSGISLPMYSQLVEKGFSRNDAGAITLIHLIAIVDDTSIFNRGGISSINFAKQYANDLIRNEKIPSISEIEEMDEIFIQRNLSAGGSADLLAVTYFLYELEKNCDEQN